MDTYEPSSLCRWVIDGTVGNRNRSVVPLIALHFTRFLTEAQFDFVTLNSCTSLSWTNGGAALDVPTCMGARQVASLSGFVDENITYYSPSGIMEVVFISDNSVNSLGFEASWMIYGDGSLPSHTCTWPCKCEELISPAGTFEDGSLAGDYSNSADCTWTIVVPGAEWVKIRFVQFDLENTYDYVRLYECPDGGKCEDPTSGMMIAELTGTSVEHGYDGWILVKGSLRVHFQSDSTITKGGFRADWKSSVQVWPYPPDYEWQRCRLPPDWSLLRPDGYDGLLRTGGLGLKMIPGYFHTWVCHYAHGCARRLGSDVWVPGTGTGSAMGARECAQSCALAGHEYWAESYQYWDQNGATEPFGCCGHLTCMQTCMMRVTGVDHAACIALVNEVDQAFESAPSEYPCDVEIGGRHYNICGGGSEPRLPGTERGEATLQGGLHGCKVGAKASATANTTDPFCWVYDEIQARFEPFGHGSTVGLL
jgi:hypothetical protein